MRELIKSITEPLSDLAFPPVCACCGDRVIDRSHYICIQCLESRFEEAQNDGDVVLPEFVLFALSLWSFDKHGYLQALLHKLKYDHCANLGIQIGKELGRKLMKTNILSGPEDWKLIAVPLHKKRFRTRGYNQSMKIAKGISQSTGLQTVDEGVVIRSKHTRTQTGLTGSERSSNISGAFKIMNTESLGEYNLLLVDDVFTTGATTFELANSFHKKMDRACGIITIAKA